MLYQEEIAKQIADFLLEIKAVILRPEDPFRWASGWLSPVYCDNRLILSEPEVRNYIRDKWVEAAKKTFPQAGAVAGVATAGIPHATLLADHIGLPMAYVRSKPKEHGTSKLIEGRLDNNTPVLVVEDLISTGKSSLQAAEAIMQEGIPVAGLMAVFTYGFPVAEEAFREKQVPYCAMCNYEIMLQRAIEKSYVKEEHLPLLKAWRENPAEWGK